MKKSVLAAMSNYWQ